jgi:rRNA maturation protein Nop10
MASTLIGPTWLQEKLARGRECVGESWLGKKRQHIGSGELLIMGRAFKKEQRAPPQIVRARRWKLARNDLSERMRVCGIVKKVHIRGREPPDHRLSDKHQNIRRKLQKMLISAR